MLAIKKTTVPKPLRIKFQKILMEDILLPEKISVSKVLNSFNRITKEVEESLKAGETKFLIPQNLQVLESYADPSSLEQVRGTLIWNALEPDNQIVPPEKIFIAKLTTSNPDDPLLLKLKETHPKKYETIMKIVFNKDKDQLIDISRFGFTVVAIPKSIEQIPDYLRPLINLPIMINSAVSNGYILLESLSIYCGTMSIGNGKTIKYNTNVIDI